MACDSPQLTDRVRCVERLVSQLGSPRMTVLVAMTM
jgi:hypothetical protein